jgi:plastocyanin
MTTRASSRSRARLLVAATVSLAALVVAAPGAAAADAAVSMVSGNQFSPGTVTIQAGETVTWTNNDSAVPHNVSGNGFSVPIVNAGASFSHTFTTAGTYPYSCTFHPPGMVGTVVVEAAPAPTATPAPTSTGGGGGGGGTGGGGGSPAATLPTSSTHVPAQGDGGGSAAAGLALLGLAGLIGLGLARRRFAS